MNQVFGDYARYYDLLYDDKDYKAETDYIIDLIKQSGLSETSVFEIGCGTGRHAVELAKRGYRVHGIDLSDNMIQIAKHNFDRFASRDILNRLSCEQADTRFFRIDRKFPVVLSLFHVMSYQTKKSDISKLFETVRAHVEDGGIFIFDCWYGSGVLSDPPVEKVKTFENETVKIFRIAYPTIHPNENFVRIDFRMIILDKCNSEYSEINEIHDMRYFFIPEILNFAECHNFSVQNSFKWMTWEEPGLNTWNALFVLRAI